MRIATLIIAPEVLHDFVNNIPKSLVLIGTRESNGSIALVVASDALPEGANYVVLVVHERPMGRDFEFIAIR